MLKVLATGSKGNSYVIQVGEEKLLLECGIAYKDILKGLNFSIKDVAGCLVTHNHKDHSKCINKIIENAIKVYAPAEVLKLNNLSKNRKAFVIKDKDTIKIGNFTVLAFKNNHVNSDSTACECLGYLIQHPKIGKILFATDTYYIKYKFKDIKHFVIECNYTENVIEELEPYQARLLKAHMSLETLKEFFKANDLSNTKDITLIHLSDNNAEPGKFKNEIEKLTGIPTYVAVPGLEV